MQSVLTKINFTTLYKDRKVIGIIIRIGAYIFRYIQTIHLYDSKKFISCYSQSFKTAVVGLHALS